MPGVKLEWIDDKKHCWIQDSLAGGEVCMLGLGAYLAIIRKSNGYSRFSEQHPFCETAKTAVVIELLRRNEEERKALELLRT